MSTLDEVEISMKHKLNFMIRSQKEVVEVDDDKESRKSHKE